MTERPDAPDRLDPQLRFQLETMPGAQLWVSVWFSTLPPADELERLGLVVGEENPATGLLGGDQINALAERPDVDQVVSRPSFTIS